MSDAVDELRQKVAISMRILGTQGMVKDITGHVSARVPGSDEMFLRCRGGNERGLSYTDVQQIRRLDFNGKGPGLGDHHMAPLELPIHGEIYKRRPEVQAVVHAHPYAAVMCGILGLELKPIFGAYDPGGLAIAAQGVPVYPRSVLISRPELGQDLVNAMGERSWVLMRGHGISVAGTSVEAATLTALRLEHLASMILEIARMGREAPTISEEDITEFSRQWTPGGRSAIPRAEEWVWRYFVQQVKDTVGIPDDI